MLLLDAASSRVQVGWLEVAGGFSPPFSARWQASDDEAGVALFENAKKLVVDVGEADAFVFCEGPGSILGIRTVAMALRTWCVLRPRPVFASASLALVAHALDRGNSGVIADARRETWHQYRIGEGLRRVPATDLGGELVMPEHFRHWAPLPPNVTRAPYNVAEMLPRAIDADIFHASDSPDAFLHEEPSYVTWTPQIHRAP